MPETPGGHCPVCRGESAVEVYPLPDAAWIPGTVVRCQGCKLLYKRLAPNAKPLADYYDTDYAALDYWGEAVATERALKPLLKAATGARDPRDRKTTLLDIGCGAGAFLKLAKAAGFRVTGLELNPILAQRTREHVGVEVLEGDFPEADLGGRRFSVITMLDLIEHLTDPVGALRRCYELLEPGGQIVIYTPNHSSLIVRTADALYRTTAGRLKGPVREIFDCLHVVFFDVHTLERAFRATGFEDIRTTLVKYDPERSQQAKGISALALRALEAVTPIAGEAFRIIAVARRPLDGGEVAIQ
jgi:SAM-dependent methyltransferase